MDLWENEMLIKLVQQTNQSGGLVAAICAAPGVLAKADVVNGNRRVGPTLPELDALMDEAGCIDSGKPVCTDGNVVTGNGPSAAEAFGQSVVDYLDSV